MEKRANKSNLETEQEASLGDMGKGLEQVMQTIRESSGALYILCGYPFSGKSHLSQLILKEVNSVYVSIDAIFSKNGYDWTSKKLPNEEGWKAIFDESYEQTMHALKRGENVLYDSTNQTKAARDKLRAIAAEVGAGAHVVHIDSDVETVRRRWRDNMKTRLRPLLSAELLEQTIQEFEIPDDNENLIVVANG